MIALVMKDPIMSAYGKRDRVKFFVCKGSGLEMLERLEMCADRSF